MRAGAVTVGLLAEALQVQIMRAMAGGFKAFRVPGDYQGELPPPPPPEAPGPVNPEHERKYAITPTGLARLPVADSIELWLLKAPGGPLPYEDRRAYEAITLLSQAWGRGFAHRLALGPATASELLEAGSMPRRKGRRLLKELQRLGLTEAAPDAGDGDTFAPTEWLRRGVAPILRGAQVEHHDPEEEAEPFDALDFEAATLLAAPLAAHEQGRSGRCRLVARIGDGGQRESSGVTVEVEDGAVIACERGLDPVAPGESSGLVTAWFRALSEQRPSRLQYDGDRELARELVTAIAWALFDEQAYVR